MARETAAQRKQREAEERAAWFEEAKSGYPLRLMRLMAQYAEIHNYAFTIHTHVPLSFEFTVRDCDGDVIFDTVLAAELESWNMCYELESAERKVESYYEEERERQRRYEVLRNAREKLNATFTAEERELLGLE